MAAKAAGFRARDEYAHDDELGIKVVALEGKSKWWNPLTNGDDALRLAVKLGLDVSHNSFGNVIVDHYTQPESSKVVLQHGSDPYAATRRAIVRAAAEIGKRKINNEVPPISD